MLVCGMVVFSGVSAFAATEQADIKPSPPVDNRLPGVTLAEGISQITGTAVSPLLGMSAVGAWKYFNTPTEKRHLLPWYCNHWVWGSCMVILGLCFLKDVAGTAAPALVKKPLDFAELFEDKASALVASSAFVPLIASAIAQSNAIQPEAAAALNPAALGLAAAPQLAFAGGFWMSFAIILPVCVLSFLAVWLACHSVNVIIAISPFGLVDAGLKLFKAGLLALITLAAFISPWLGALVCVPLIIIAFYISGWTFRLMVFGNLLGLDILLNRKAPEAKLEEGEGVRAFNLQEMGNTPLRSYGKLHRRENGELIFSQRPWLIMPAKEVRLEAEPDGLEKGVLYPTVTHKMVDGRVRGSFLLLPRYRHCVSAVGSTLEIEKITDSKLIQSYKTVRKWFTDVFNSSRQLIDSRLAKAAP